MTGIVETIAALVTEEDAVMADSQGAGTITPARVRQLMEDLAVTLTTIGFNAQVGTTYTLQTTDIYQCVKLTNASTITVTLPNSLPIGFQCTIFQGGAGQVVISAASGAVILNRFSFTKLAGQYASATLAVMTNVGGTAANYLFVGDGST